MDRIERLLKDWEPQIKAAFLESVKTIRDRVVLADLVRALKAGNIEAALSIVGIEPVNFRPLAATLERFFEAAGIDATVGVNQGRGVGLAIFDVRAPRADNWIRTHATQLITQITEDQRQMVREALSPLRLGGDQLLTGDTPQKLALDLVGRVSTVTRRREGGVLGLNAEQAKWAQSYADSLADVPKADALTRKLRDKRFDRTVAKAIREGTPIPAKTREAMVEAYRNRALRLRAETIALNEASEVAHEAQVEAWRQAVGRGVVAEAAVKRFWLDAEDSHVRPWHREVKKMNPNGVGLEQPFATPKGPTMQPGWRFDPGCRCRVRVRVVDAGGTE